MKLEAFFTSAYNLFVAYPLPALAIGVILAIFLWKKPGEFFKFALMVSVLVGGIYAAIQFGQTAKHGTDGKKTLTDKSEEALVK